MYNGLVNQIIQSGRKKTGLVEKIQATKIASYNINEE